MGNATAKAFVRRNTTLQPLRGLEHIRLHLTDDILALWRQTQLASGEDEAPLPYWAIAWAGGQALARFIRDNPAAITQKRILDFGSGSGLVGIAAARAGAAHVTAADIDPLAAAAIELNARANATHIDVSHRDLLADPEPPPDTDLILAADCWYEAAFAARVTPWLQSAAAAGIEVLIADPGRRYMPPADLLEQLGTYAVRTTADLEDLDQKSASVYRLKGATRDP